MRIAITGATGNLGTALLQALREDGDHEIVGIARRRPPDEPPYAGVAWHTVDVAAPTPPSTGSPVSRMPTPSSTSRGVSSPPIDATTCGRPGSTDTRRARGRSDGRRRARRAHVFLRRLRAGSYGRPVDESWPTTGVRSSVYSRDKVAAEDVVRRHVDSGTGPSVTVLRAGLIGQYRAGNQLLHYILPDWAPAGVLRVAPVVPIDRGMCIPAVHAEEAARAIVLATRQRKSGIYNIASDVPATGADVLADSRSMVCTSRPTAAGGRPGDVAAAPATRRRRLDRPGVLDSARGSRPRPRRVGLGRAHRGTGCRPRAGRGDGRSRGHRQPRPRGPLGAHTADVGPAARRGRHQETDVTVSPSAWTPAARCASPSAGGNRR